MLVPELFCTNKDVVADDEPLPFTNSLVVGEVVPIPTFPELDINNRLLDPEVILNDPVPKLTEAETDPVAIKNPPPPPPEPPFKAKDAVKA